MPSSRRYPRNPRRQLRAKPLQRASQPPKTRDIHRSFVGTALHRGTMAWRKARSSRQSSSFRPQKASARLLSIRGRGAGVDRWRHNLLSPAFRGHQAEGESTTASASDQRVRNLRRRRKLRSLRRTFRLTYNQSQQSSQNPLRRSTVHTLHHTHSNPTSTEDSGSATASKPPVKADKQHFQTELSAANSAPASLKSPVQVPLR
jgi:hypothetical protein